MQLAIFLQIDLYAPILTVLRTNPILLKIDIHVRYTMMHV